MGISIVKDKKGPSFFASHVRCGVTEGIWLTPDELYELKDKLNSLLNELTT